jgi:hypothetical protein
VTAVAVLLSTGSDAAGRGSSQWWCGLWARDWLGIPASLSVAVSLWNRHWQKLTVFLPSANRSATFRGGSFYSSARRDGCGGCEWSGVCASSLGRGLTQRNLVSTLEQSPARGDTAATQDLFLGTAPVSKRDGRAYQRQSRPHRYDDSSGWVHGCHTQRGVNSRGQGQADLPAQQPPPRTRARVSATDAHPGRPGDRVESARQGSPQANCVIRRGI